MSTVKTAISIDSNVFKKVDKLAKVLHLSRSQFFTQAAQYMVDKSANLELLNKINAVFTDQPSENDRRKIEKRYHQRKVSEPW